jgi:hypothetical protein
MGSRCATAAFEPPIHVVDAFGLQSFGTAHIVFEHGIAAINDDVSGATQLP